jgi:flagellar motor protein MotB
MEQLEQELSHDTPVWAIFGDLMAGLVGVFVLILVWVLGYQLQLTQSLEEEVSKRQVEEQRRMELEQALAGPLASGRVTLRDGKIGISGSVLFSLNSAALQREGREVLRSLVAPLQVYLGERDELLMVSGFTDDLPIQSGNDRFDDNWELSAQRALTVTRALIEEGMDPAIVFAAAFGAQQPVATNTDEDGRSRNRRVEMAPVPRTSRATSDNG